MAIGNNEGKACDAVVKLLETRTGKDRADLSHPERNGIGPPVDLRLTLGTQSYAIEHTLIEAYPDQIQTAVEFGQFINPIMNELSGTLPTPGVYDLYFPNDSRLRVRAKHWDRIRSDFIEWVREHAARLHEKNPVRPTEELSPHGIEDEYRAKPPEFPYEVTLRREVHCSDSLEHDGVLFVSRIAPRDVEAQRAVRLQRALKRKCPKLQRCKEEGARTVLVLEDCDICLSNHFLIGDRLAELLGDHADLPDEIYLVETHLDRWKLRVMKHDDRCLPEQDRTEFHSAELADITAPDDD